MAARRSLRRLVLLTAAAGLLSLTAASAQAGSSRAVPAPAVGHVTKTTPVLDTGRDGCGAKHGAPAPAAPSSDSL
jgi:hypothetical protein